MFILVTLYVFIFLTVKNGTMAEFWPERYCLGSRNGCIITKFGLLRAIGKGEGHTKQSLY